MPFHKALIVNRKLLIGKKNPDERTAMSNKQSFSANKPAFTLIELLVVIAIIGILSTTGFFAFTSSQKRARDTQRKNDLAQVKKAMEAAKNDCKAGSFYPDLTDFSALSTYLSNSNLNYLQSTVSDPSNTGLYVYSFNKSGGSFTNVCNATNRTITQSGVKTYVLRVKLEIDKDPDANKSQTSCEALFGTSLDKVNITPAPAADDGYYYVCPD